MIINTTIQGSGGLEYETGTWSPTSDTTTAPTIYFANSHSKAPALIVFCDTSTSARADNDFIAYWWVDFSLSVPNWDKPSGSWPVGYQSYSRATSSSTSSGTSVQETSSPPPNNNNQYFEPYISHRRLYSSRVYNWIAIWV